MDLDQLREQLEEEQESRSDLQRALTKANNEVTVWRQKFESGEGGVRSEEMDELKRKMNAKVMELEAQLEAAQSKAANMEKVKSRLQGELEDLTIEVERVRDVAVPSTLSMNIYLNCVSTIREKHLGLFYSSRVHKPQRFSF